MGTIAFGFDNFAVRAFGWKAPRLIDYAAELGVDVLLLSDLDVYESLGDATLREVRARADAVGIAIHVGTGSICATSSMFDPRRGTPEEHLRTTIRVARALGSPVARCFLGRGEDRTTHGGIETHVRAVIATFRAVRGFAMDSGVRIALENHAGDLQARELAALIDEAGRDFVGATMDAGNATWTLEDPLASLEVLAPYAVTTGIRDSMVWDSPAGAFVQWVPMGQGLVDWKAYVERYGRLCPRTPFVLETILSAPREFPYLRPEFWREWPNALARDLSRFVTLARKGKPGAPADGDRAEVQKAALESSLRYCRDVLGLGIRKP